MAKTLEDKLEFMAFLPKGVTLKAVEKTLNKNGIYILNYYKNLDTLLCETRAGNYAALFQTAIELNPLKAGHVGYDCYGYRELMPATVPKALRKKLSTVCISSTPELIT